MNSNELFSHSYDIFHYLHSLQQDGYIEHIWHTQNPQLEITGISDRQEYT
jgi:hypothetical protein